jgi:tetratricopeptide (TPR) repeat protein
MGHARSAEEVPFPVNEGAYAYRLLSELYYFKNKVMLSFYAGAKAVNLAETAGERHPVLARTYANAYVGLSTTGRNWAARIYKRLALTTSEKVNKSYVTAPVLVRLGMYDVVRGQWTSARSLIEQSITLYDKMNDKRGWNEAQYLLGFLTYIKGDFGNGADRFDDLAISAQLIGNTDHRVVGLSGYAMNLLALGKTRLAVVQLEQAKPLWEHPHLEPAALLYSQSVYALAAARQGEIERAISVAANALEQLDSAFHPSVMASPFGALLLAQVYVELAKDNDAAAPVDEALERILVALNRLGKTFAVVAPYLELYKGHAAHFAGRDSRARRHWQTALNIGREMAIPYVEGMAHFTLFQQAEIDSSDWNTHRAGASRIFEELSAEYYLEQLKKR